MKTIIHHRLRLLSLILWLATSYVASAFYDPTIGRWLSRDPIGEEGGLNIYHFNFNSPINRIDTDGRGSVEANYAPCPRCGQLYPRGYNCKCGQETQQPYGTAVDNLMEGTIELFVPISAAQALYEGDVMAVAGEYALGKLKLIGNIPIVKAAGQKCCVKIKAGITWFKKPIKHNGKIIDACVDLPKQPLLLPAPNTTRLPQDIAVNPNSPPQKLPLLRSIGGTPAQQQALAADIQSAIAQNATDIRVNQQQVNALGIRVGINRPDLQYTLPNNRRVYIEYDNTAPSTWPNTPRGSAHGDRILANDPNGAFIPKSFD